MTGKVGDRSVVIGNVGDREIGADCVIIGATDQYGNTILNKPMAVGSGAKAGPESTSIGYQAQANLGWSRIDVHQALADLELLIQQRCDEQIQSRFELLKKELISSSPNKGLVASLASSINFVSTLDGASNVYGKIMRFIDTLPSS